MSEMNSNSPTQNAKPFDDSETSEWWRGAVIYQVYPRSFLDTNGDGIGDLRGVVERLDYIAGLGVDAIWLSPFFTSPMRDFGYDVADYCGVDPIFGTLADFDALIGKAHSLGLKVLIDQVYSHTSNQHAWFEESRNNRTNPKADWYVWSDPKADGAPPNNWQSVFTGCAWEWESRRQQYYLHNFLTSQPDLNLHNPDVQDAVLEVARFWLDRGVDGFRLDALNFAMHDPQLRDNPAAPVTNRSRTRPFDYQLHTRNQSHPGIPKFLERIRRLTDQYRDIFTVAEVVGPDPTREMKSFTRGNTRLNSAYNFAFLYAGRIDAGSVKTALRDWIGDGAGSWPSWAFSNHDAPRAASRWASQKHRHDAAKIFSLLLLSLRGNIFLYQGEELGLPQAEVPFDKLKDPEAIANWPHTLGRDGARTPMPWRRDEEHAGFSDAEPWLPIDPRHLPSAVDAQELNPDSTLHFTRRLIALRRQNAALRSGGLAFAQTPGDVLAFYRQSADEKLLCVFNLGAKSTRWLPASDGKLRILASAGAVCDAAPAELPAYSGYIAACSSAE